jgi:hypothetical protein
MKQIRPPGRRGIHLAAIGALLAALTVPSTPASAQTLIPEAHLYHNHMPNFWPFYAIPSQMSSVYNNTAIGAPIRYTYDGDVIALKNNPPAGYPYYNPGGTIMPHDDLVSYYSANAKYQCYQGNPPGTDGNGWPIDESYLMQSYAGGLGQVHITFSGALANDVNSLELDNVLSGYYTDGTSWNANWLTCYNGLKTNDGFNTLDIVHFAGHHALGPLVGNDFLLKDLIFHGATMAEPFFLGSSYKSSHGFFPTELSFSERMIPALSKLGVQWSLMGNNHFSRCLQDYPFATYDATGDCMDSPPNRADLQDTSSAGSWIGEQVDHQQQVVVNKFPFGSTPHWVRWVDPSTGAVSEVAGVPVSQNGEYAEGWDGSVTTAEYQPYVGNTTRQQFFVVAHDGDNSSGRSGSLDTWENGITVTGNSANGGYNLGIDEYLKKYPIPSTDVQHVQDGSWVDVMDSCADPYFYHWHLPPLIWSGQFSAFNSATGQNLAPKTNLKGTAEGATVSLSQGWHFQELAYAKLMAPLNYAKTAEQIWLGAHPTYWSPTTALDNQVTYPGNQLNPWMIAAPVKGDPNNDYKGGANPAELAWYFLLPAMDSGFGYYGENTDDDIKPVLAFNNSLFFSEPYVNANLAQDKTGPSVWVPQRYPYNPGEVNASKAEGWTTQWYNNQFAIYTYAYDVSGVASMKVMVRTHSSNTINASDDTYKVYNPSAMVGKPGLSITPSNVSAWTAYNMSMRDMHPVMNGVSWIPSDQATMAVVPTQDIGNMYYCYFNQYRNQMVDYYVEATDTKGNVTDSDIQTVFIGPGTYSAGGLSGYTADPNGTVQGTSPFLTIDYPGITPQAATPTFSPAAGGYSSPQTVSISDSTSGATIYYTTNGTTPTTSSTVYTGPFTVSSGTVTVNAIATASGVAQSNVGTATYSIGVGGGTLSGTGTAVKATSAVNLTTLGTSDWAHWGQSSATAFDHKSAGGSQISNETVVGSGTVGQFTDSIQQTTWTDGTPTASATSSPNGIYITGVNNGFSFTVPADTTKRTLTVYVGGYKSGGKLTAHLSDFSTGDYTDSSMSGTATGTDGSHFYGYYTLSYAAASTGQSLTVTWSMASDAGSGNITMQAATLAGGTTPPQATTPTFSPAAGTYTSAQSVTISDATAGSTVYYTTDGSTPTTSSTKYTGAITVGATETIKALATASGYTNSSVGSAAYTINLPQAGAPTFTPASGTYTAAQSVTIADGISGATIYYTTNGTTPTTASTQYAGPITVSSTTTVEAIAVAAGYTQSTVSSATYTITNPSGGSLTGSGTAVKATTAVNLTTVGTSDWGHWGQSSASSFDHKSAGGSQIGNVSVVGSGSLGQFTDSIQQMTWTDGTPTASATSSPNGVWISGIGNGLSVTAPADTTQRTLIVYVGGYKSGGKLTAHLSDGSAADFVDSSMLGASTGTDGSHYYATYTLTYKAASAGQTLTVSWIMASDAGSGNITLQAAALQGGTTPVAGSLTGSGTAVKATASTNLTTQGTTDWAHWGQSSATAFDHKSSGGSKISNVSVVGSGSIGQFTDSIQQMTWTDGTPTASVTNSPNGIFIAGVNNGVSFTAPADTTQRTVTVYVGGYKSGGKLTAHLSDGSAADFVDSSMSGASTGTDGSHYYGYYTLTYKAASAGQTLKVSWTMASDAGSGNVTLQSATLH